MATLPKISAIDTVRAKFASATQTFWVCPITDKKILASDSAAIAKHQQCIIAKEQAKLSKTERTKSLRALTKELLSIATVDDFRSWMLKRLLLEDPAFDAGQTPEVSVHTSNGNCVFLGGVYFLRIQGVRRSSVPLEIRKTLGLRQGRSFANYQVGTDVDAAAWFHEVPYKSKLHQEIQAWNPNKKLTDAEKDRLAAQDPEYVADIAQVAVLAAQIHALRNDARVLIKKCEVKRTAACVTLPAALM